MILLFPLKCTHDFCELTVYEKQKVSFPNEIITELDYYNEFDDKNEDTTHILIYGKCGRDNEGFRNMWKVRKRAEGGRYSFI